jgi:hypothetical protein
VIYCNQGYRDQDALNVCLAIDKPSFGDKDDCDSNQLALLTILELLPQDLLIAYMHTNGDHSRLCRVVSRLCDSTSTLNDEQVVALAVAATVLGGGPWSSLLKVFQSM